MSAGAWTELRLALGGALRLAVGDRRGLAFFDPSVDGFWRSFRAAAICYPLYLLLLGFRLPAARWAASGIATILIVETIAFIISWVAFPLVILPLARRFGREDRFFAFMVPYNWSQIPQTVLFALVGAERAAGLLSPADTHVAELAAAIAVLVYEWYIARVALAVNGAQAMVVVVVDLALGTALGRVTETLY